MEMDFEGKTVLVTGGARGIGAAVCSLFFRKHARVVVNYLEIPEDLKAIEAFRNSIGAGDRSRVRFLPGDICREKTIDDLQALLDSDFRGIDILVNSAGFSATPPGLQNETRDLWRKLIDINLSGAFYMTQAVVSSMIEKKWGRLIYIGSAGSISGGAGPVGYSAAKAGINGMVRALSKELAPKGITVNAVLPAIIETDLLREREPDPEKRKTYISRIPVGRIGTSDDVAQMVMFLASDYAGYISGQQILVDGGSTYK